MTKHTGARRAGDESWNRQDNLPKGFRLYTSKKWVRFLLGQPEPRRPDERPLSPAAQAARWLPEEELARLIDGEDISGSGRYLTVTARLACLRRVMPKKPVRLHLQPRGAPIFRENDCPPPGWLDRAKAIWAKLPKNDSDIFDRPAATQRPKLARLAERLAPLLHWRRMGKPIRPSTTNWLQPDNDNYNEDQADARPAVDAERRYRAGPKEKTLIRMAGPVDMTFRHARFGGGGDTDCRPLFPVRMGKLRFSNGRQEERGERMPRGAILNYEDDFTELLGSEPDLDEIERRRRYWASLFGTSRAYGSDEFHKQNLEPTRFIRTGRIRRKVMMTPAEQREVLATQPHPPITYCKPGLPCGHEDIGAQFVGGWISQTKGKSGIERWEDVSDELSRQAEFERWARELPPEQQKALNLACTVANFTEVGEAFGKRGKNAERYGKKILLAANDNLKEIMAA